MNTTAGQAGTGSSKPLWRELPIRIILPVALTVILFGMTVFLVILPSVENNLMARKREMIRELTRSACNTLARFEEKEASGTLSRQQAQAEAMNHLRHLRYGPENKDYFWITDINSRILMHPYRPDLEGTDGSNLIDRQGKRFIVEFSKVAREQGAGYVEYWWQWQDEPERVVPKISYVKLFKPWGWVIGTGIYIEDVHEEINALTRQLTLIGLGILVLITALSSYVIWEGARSEKKRRSAEDSLRQSERRFRAIFNQTFQFIGLMKPDGTLLEANQTVLDFFQTDKAEVVGKLLWETPWWSNAPQQRQRLREAVEQAAAGQFVRFEMVFPSPDGTLYPFDFSIKPVRDEAGNVVLLIPEGHDISGLKEAEEQLRRLNVELEQRVAERTAELRASNTIIQDKNRALAETIEDLREREQLMADQLKLAQEVQQQFLPKEFPFGDELQFAAFYRSSSTIGGDLYDAFRVSDRVAGFYIADVAGHGVSAALVTAVLKVSFERFRHTHPRLAGSKAEIPQYIHSLSSFTTVLNQALLETIPEQTFATFLLGLLRLDTGELLLANAGHDPPIWYRGDLRSAQLLEVPSNIPLGVAKEWEYEIAQFQLQPGDKLVIYTDGLTELMNEQREEFGVDRLMETIRNSGHLSSEALVKEITKETSRFAENQEPHDDQALLVMDYRQRLSEAGGAT